jgi:hypothetical protein
MTTTMNPFDDDKLWNNVMAENILTKLPMDLVNKICEYVPEPIFKKKQEFKAGLYKLVRKSTNDKRLGIYIHPIYNYRDPMFERKIYKIISIPNTDLYTNIKETAKQFKITKRIKRYTDIDGVYNGFKEEINIINKTKFQQKDGYKIYKVDSCEVWIWIEKDSDNTDLILPWKDYYEDAPAKIIIRDEAYYTEYYRNYNHSA